MRNLKYSFKIFLLFYILIQLLIVSVDNKQFIIEIQKQTMLIFPYYLKVTGHFKKVFLKQLNFFSNFQKYFFKYQSVSYIRRLFEQVLECFHYSLL